jgi:hypothetical protein
MTNDFRHPTDKEIEDLQIHIATEQQRRNKLADFEKELIDLIKKYGYEDNTNTDAEVLADYMVDCLSIFESAISWRDKLKSDKNE